MADVTIPVPQALRAHLARPGFGARDRTLPGAAAKLERALQVNGIVHDVKAYPDAGHSFLNNHPSIWFTLVGKLIGGGYDEQAATDARRRILAFFGRELGGWRDVSTSSERSSR